jgi:DNA-binding NarL/FixJ family response regulator
MLRHHIPQSRFGAVDETLDTLLHGIREQREALHRNLLCAHRVNTQLATKLNTLRDLYEGMPLLAEFAPIWKRIEMLSPQQRRVFERVVIGDSNKAIAYDLGLSQKTVETHRARVMRKLRASSLAELVRFATRAAPQAAASAVSNDPHRSA